VRFLPSDIVTILFSLIFSSLCIYALYKNFNLWHILILYLSFAIFQTFLVLNNNKNYFLKILRELIFPLVTVFSIFDSLTLLIPAVNPKDIDYLLIRLDYLIFGGYPTLLFEDFLHPLLSDFLQICYSLYYFMPFMLGIALKIKGNDTAFERSLFLVLLCFYLSYLGYVIFPALGPRYAIEHLHSKEIVDGALSGFIRDILNFIEGTKRDAFPSGHTGISLLLLLLSWSYARKLFWLFLIITLGLLTATIYFRYHYVVDLIGGVILTVVTIIIGKVYYSTYKSFTKIQR